MTIDNKSFELLASFAHYCAEHPEERFWQALRNWSGMYRILAQDSVAGPKDTTEFGTPQNTFYWEGRNGYKGEAASEAVEAREPQE